MSNICIYLLADWFINVFQFFDLRTNSNGHEIENIESKGKYSRFWSTRSLSISGFFSSLCRSHYKRFRLIKKKIEEEEEYNWTRTIQWIRSIFIFLVRFESVWWMVAADTFLFYTLTIETSTSLHHVQNTNEKSILFFTIHKSIRKIYCREKEFSFSN